LLKRPLGQVEFDPASAAFDGHDASYDECRSRPAPSANLKPNIYYKAQDFTLGIHRAPGHRAESRVDFRFGETAGDEGEPAGLKVSAQPGLTELALAPEMAAHAGFSFGESAARMVEDAACDR
jgi:D-alanine-D-alanine ligase